MILLLFAWLHLTIARPVSQARRGAGSAGSDCPADQALPEMRHTDGEEQRLQSHDLHGCKRGRRSMSAGLVLDMRPQVWRRWGIPDALCVVESLRLPRHPDAGRVPALGLLRAVVAALPPAALQASAAGRACCHCAPRPRPGDRLPARIGTLACHTATFLGKC